MNAIYMIQGKPLIQAGEIISCKTHRSYRVIRPPRSSCVVCWTMWLHRLAGKGNATPRDLVFAEQLLSVFGIQEKPMR